jgi:hydroxypyruvate isomerase
MQEVGAGNLSMLLDTFHTANAGIDPVAFVREHAAAIGHVHVADLPGRHEPGSGKIDFPAFFDELERQGYAGAIGLEYVPAGETTAGLTWRDAYA